MSKNKLILENSNSNWNADRRYKVNDIVSYGGYDYQNKTGANSDPNLSVDWIKIPYYVGNYTKTEVDTADTNTLNYAKSYADGLVIGLLDDRGNYNPSTNSNLYPTTGGSGASGSILKGDLWSINGLGSGVSAVIGGKTVTDGDVVRALINAPSNTDANWVITENNFGYVAENAANKSNDIETDKASTSKYGNIAAWIVWLKTYFFSNLPAKSSTLVDADLIIAGDSADSFKTKTRTFTQLKATLKTYFDTFYLVPQITITLTGNITTATTDASGLGQNGRHNLLDNGATARNLTCNGGVTASYGKVGTGEITFVQGSGRTLVQLTGTAVLNGILGSEAKLWSFGTTDYLTIINY